MLLIELPIQMYKSKKKTVDPWTEEEGYERVPSDVDVALINPDTLEEVWSIDKDRTGIGVSSDGSRREIPMKYDDVVQYLEYCNTVIVKELDMKSPIRWINIIRWDEDWQKKAERGVDGHWKYEATQCLK